MSKTEPTSDYPDGSGPFGFKCLLLGPTGSGKTSAIRTLLDAGMDTFVLATEPGLLEVLGKYRKHPNFHWCYMPPAPANWDNMIQVAQRINTASQKTLADVADPGKRDYDQFIEFLGVLADFRDQHGESFGAVDTWGTDKCLVIDSATGINVMAMNLTAGYRPVVSPGEWGTAMRQIDHLHQSLCASLKCHLVVTGHIEREFNEITGSINLMVSMPGKKLAPSIPRWYSDVVLCKRDGKIFNWSTMEQGIDLKNRNLPLADNIKPDFGALLKAWKERTDGDAEA